MQVRILPFAPNRKEMKVEKKYNYLRIALGLQRIAVDHKMAMQIIETYEKILELGDDFSIRDATEIELKMSAINEEELINKAKE